MPKAIEIIARAAVIRHGEILLCRLRNAKWYFLPGGHVEPGEKTTQTLSRELKEELKLSIQNPRFIGAVENFYRDGKGSHHEINLVFAAKLKGYGSRSAEGHIQFEWMPLKSLPRTKILPAALKKCLLRWLKDKRPFLASQIN